MTLSGVMPRMAKAGEVGTDRSRLAKGNLASLPVSPPVSVATGATVRAAPSALMFSEEAGESGAGLRTVLIFLGDELRFAISGCFSGSGGGTSFGAGFRLTSLAVA